MMNNKKLTHVEAVRIMAGVNEATDKANLVIDLQRDIKRACQANCPHDEIEGNIPYHDVSNIIQRTCKTCRKSLGSIANRRYCKHCNKKVVTNMYQTGGKSLCGECNGELPELIGKDE